jgi:hypothetical protein
MPRPIAPDVLRARALDVLTQMEQFNVAHPAPTFTEIEDAVEAALAGLRHDLVTQSLQGQALADFRGSSERPACPGCGAPLQANGQHQRTVLTHGDLPVSVARTRGRCSACGTELFPPG